MLPKRVPQHQIDARAVALIRQAVAQHGWIYRDLTEDYGVDAELEIISANGDVTGSKLYIQIKGSRSDLRAVRLKTSTLRYFGLAVWPVFLVHVNVTSQRIVMLYEDWDNLLNKPETRHTISVSLRESIPLDEAWLVIQDVVSEWHSAILDMNSYTLYNPSAQAIRWIILLKIHGGDIDQMLQWMRENASDDQLTYDYGYCVFLKRQAAEDPNLIEKIRQAVIDIFPELEGDV